MPWYFALIRTSSSLTSAVSLKSASTVIVLQFLPPIRSLYLNLWDSKAASDAEVKVCCPSPITLAQPVLTGLLTCNYKTVDFHLIRKRLFNPSKTALCIERGNRQTLQSIMLHEHLFWRREVFCGSCNESLKTRLNFLFCFVLLCFFPACSGFLKFWDSESPHEFNSS